MSTSHPPSPHIYPLDAPAVSAISASASASVSASLVHHHPPMGQQKQHNSLSIVLPSPFLCLRGTGVSVDPCVLRGHVLLELFEATAFKDINLQFRGKARLPTSQSESSSVLSGNYSNSVIFNHEWSFLQGELTHTPTLKAGRHVFPFTLQIEDWLPSTLSIHSGLAGIGYKLRATAVRPGFSSNLHAVSPVKILRSFPSEALEYQQTLELENTWPEKLMYAIMVPHKAWAAGDTLCALVKFSPLSKGIRITGITTSLHEHLKTFGRSGATHDENRVACSVKHEIHNGRAVSVPFFSAANSLRWTQQQNHSPFSTNLSTPSASDDARSSLLSEPFNPSTAATPNSGRSPLDTPLDVASSLRNTSLGDGSSPALTNLPGNSSSATIVVACLPGDHNIDIGEQEIVTTLELPLPSTLTPTHAVEPVFLSHRLRWNILLSNPDGHVSELRCSLPIHILDSSILEDARAATRVTRRLLFGLEIAQDDGDEIQLPSYPSHVMDRVPDNEEQAAAALATMGGSQNGTPSGLDWVNMQLMTDGQRSHPASPPDSRLASRTSSRAPSPERRDSRERGHHGFFSSLKPFTKVTSSFSNHSRQNGQSHMHGDNNSHATDESSSSSLSLTLSPSHGSATPSGSFPPTPDRSQPGTPPLSYPTIQNGTPQRRPISASASASASRTSSPLNTVITLPGTDTTTGIDNEVAALSRVPHYAIASRGFLGGITPISSLRGLPSYEEASRPSRTTAASPVSTVVDSLPSSHSLGRQLPALMPIQSTREMSRRSAAERSFSEGDLAARFANVSQRR